MNNQLEYFQNIPDKKLVPYDMSTGTKTENGVTRVIRPQYTMFCNDEKPIEPNPNFVSLNQNLAGPPNPKTLLKPVVVPPPAALDFWRANNLINHSHINTESQRDTYLSGYEISNCCDNIDIKKMVALSIWIIDFDKLKGLNE